MIQVPRRPVRPDKGQALLMSNLNRQAYIQGINDDFLIACFITLAGGLPVIFLKSKKSTIKNITANE